MKVDFEHIQAAHCESGVTRNLLKHIGVEKITEPLAFGIGAGLFFTYLPFIKVNNAPAFAFRTMPGLIFKTVCKSLDIDVVRKKFSSKEEAQTFLDSRLSEGFAVGSQVGVYYLSYFPKEYRFHFNAHNIVVFGKEDGKYFISDPIMENVEILTEYELERVRFARGALAPKGQVYYAKLNHPVIDEKIKQGIKKGVRKNIFNMLRIPGPFAGVNSIVYTGKKIKGWRDKYGLKKSGLYLAQLVRMQEEIGTGGGGFRFMYAAFLQEAYMFFQNDELLKVSEIFTKAGDLWRDAAVQASGIYKGRIGTQQDFDTMGDYLLEIADVERNAFKALSKMRF
ncbi:MAG: BtrH N-terminal domain-containing protein [Arachidicoccus sp.]|nr:BtrH N-terminal domain-containing protein [Arachidicoccus sp.]